MGEIEIQTESGNMKEMNHWEDLDEVGKMLLKWILSRYGVTMRTALNWRRIQLVDAFCEHGNGYLGLTKRSSPKS
jgi:hypothetical protein